MTPPRQRGGRRRVGSGTGAPGTLGLASVWDGLARSGSDAHPNLVIAGWPQLGRAHGLRRAATLWRGFSAGMIDRVLGDSRGEVLERIRRQSLLSTMSATSWARTRACSSVTAGGLYCVIVTNEVPVQMNSCAV